MMVSFTGIAWLFGGLAIGFLSFRLLQYARRDKTTVAWGWFWFTFFTVLFILVTTIGGLFFAEDFKALRLVVIVVTFLEAIVAGILGYLIVFLRLPKISPKVGFLIPFLFGLGTLYYTITIPFVPFLEPYNAINWDIKLLPGLLRLILFIFTWVPAGLIFFQQHKNSQDQRVRDRAVGIGVVIAFGFIISFLDFLLETVLHLSAVSSEIAVILFSIVTFVIIFQTQKPLPPEAEYTPPKYPQIRW